MVPFDEDLAPWSVNKLEAFFQQLEAYVENNPRDDAISVGQLTAADRTSWARVSWSLDTPIWQIFLQNWNPISSDGHQ